MMNRPVVVTALLFALLSLSFSSAYAAKQSYYRWTDAKGNVTYGKTPPAGIDATMIDVHTGRSIPAPAKPAEEKVANNDQSGLPEMESQLEPGEAKRLCEMAKKNLALMERAGLIRMKNDEGEPVVLDAEAKQRQVDKANEAIKTYCK
ncbi:uncharacterized protein DUF4124 [Sinobacterium caligoides]|uniref:Uncharacterized protein DUF4124 n=1 Tax=Sinobacterium caligoides TaxID=933926 RepID=A0A3N2E199_9GAMM|nr:DUF4124 domain-containing protein [Sinobacterium caligoides]ROS05797.1 uncharacterized protein DUF4124 [Sinobacterium caligoides]